MKFIKLLLLIVLAAAIVASLWYFRPWSEYSPANFAELEKPEKLTYNFTHMAELIPARTLIKSNTPRDIPVAGQADLLSLTYDFAGQTKTLDDFVKESSTLGLLVVKDGQIEYEQYFQGTSDESLYTSWSMAKSFVATVIAKAVHDGLIESWDDPAEKYAPQYAGSDFGATSIRALIDMASGIEFDENYASETSDIRPFFFGAFIQQKDPDSLLLKFKRSRAEYNDFEYISPNSHVLSAVLRGVYKERLVDIMQREIWEPLGMASNANWLQHKDGDQGQALGYCCLNATLKDYARFGLFHMQAQLGEGQGVEELPSEWVARLTKPATETHEPGGDLYSGRGYSSHFWLPIDGEGMFFAAGVYGQFIWMDPARNLMVVRTSSDPNWTPRYPESEATMKAILNHFAN